MNEISTFGVIGGDIRFIRVAQRLSGSGNNVLTAGLGDELEDTQLIKKCSVKEIMENCSFVILPLPISTDGEYINAPDSSEKISLKSIFLNCRPNQLVFGGKMNETVMNALSSNGAIPIDYLEREDLAIQNAIPTAEGAIAIAMQEMSRTIYQSRCLVTGYGRIAKILSRYLHALGADVTVAARKINDLTWAHTQGYGTVHIKDMLLDGSTFDVIFNTVPSKIFDCQKLRSVNKDCIIIDLASKPGGIDFAVAKELGVKVIWALSLPGKVAPISAGDIIYETIMTIISERSANLE